MSVKNQWYCGVERQQYGPYTWEQMRAMADEGRLIADSYVRREVDQQWLTASQVPGLLKKKAKPAPGANGSAQVAAAAAKQAGNSPTSAMADPPAEPPVVAPPGSDGSAGGNAVKVRPVQPAAATMVRGIPVGSAIAPAVSVAVQPAAAAAKAKWKTDEEDEPQPQQSNTLLIAGVLAGVVIFVGLAGVGLVVWKRGRDRARQQAEAQAAVEKAAAELVAALPATVGETNPLTAAESNPAAPAAPQSPASIPPVEAAPAAAAAASNAARPADAAAARLIGKLSGWIDVTRTGGIKLLDVRLVIDSAWLAADEAGTRVEPDTNAASAKYVFVAVKLTNTAKALRSYTSWNATAGTSVVLADGSGRPLALIPAHATPAASRLAQVDIPPGQILTDTLVFEAPSGSVEKLRLALAKAAIAGNAKTRGTHFAFEIPREVLLRGAPGARPAALPAAVRGEGPIAASQAASATPQDPVAGALGAAAAPMPGAPLPGAAPAPAPPAAPKFDPKAFDLELQKQAGLIEADGKAAKGDDK